MTDWKELQRAMGSSERMRRAAGDASPDIVGDGIVAALDRMSGRGLDQDLRHLAGQVRRQQQLPRDPRRDHRFFTHLEWALRDLAIRPLEPRLLPTRPTGDQL
ncbi:hypothetical protein ABE438_14600 [Bosea sp. TWI1241]|uniref:hypothetical protein n=1 Tax=Bosea sp. TWI1241 TaxID=3148904 RepID=UPI00320A1B3E